MLTAALLIVPLGWLGYATADLIAAVCERMMR